VVEEVVDAAAKVGMVEVAEVGMVEVAVAEVGMVVAEEEEGVGGASRKRLP